MSRSMRLVLCAVWVIVIVPRSVLHAQLMPTPNGPWEARVALPTDQKREWSEKGYLPKWCIVWEDRERPTVRIEDDEKGDCRGYAFIGRTYAIPKDLPRELKASFRYKTCCAASKPPFERAGAVGFYVLTPEQWAALASDPTHAKPINLWRASEFAESGTLVYKDQQDISDWREWTSHNLAPELRRYAGQSVVLALAWGCHHQGCVEWGAFDDFRFTARMEAEMVREFFNSLDLDYPGIEQVKAAVHADDIPAARRALVAYMKARTKPAPPPLSPRNDAGFLAAADQIVDHVFRFVGCPPHQLGKNILWNEDPFDYDQWAIALNRHSHWVTLGQAYAGTKDEKYAKEFVAQLTGWIAAMPVNIGAHFAQGPYHVPGRSPLSLDAGIRMGQTWFPAYYYFLHSPSFTEEAHVAMLRSFREHALYLMDERHFKAGSNWGMMETNGLFHIGVMLPEFKEAETWRRTAIERMNAELDNQFYPDGAQTELTPGYHSVSVGNTLGFLDVAKQTDTKLPDEITGKLERTFQYYVRIVMPDGTTPALNDSGRGTIQRWMEKGFALFPHREDFRFLAAGGKEGRSPEFASCAMDYAGWYIMRTGGTSRDKYLLFDAGPFGTGHQHEDKLHLILHAFGRTLITEPGNYSYDRSDWRKYVLSTRGHNTIMVDGEEQSRRLQRDTWRSMTALPNRWITSDDVDYAEGTYADGYGEKMDKTVTHTRRVLFVKPDYWIVVDELKPSDDKEHTYESLFHLESPGANVNPETQVVTTTNPTGGNVAIVPLTPSGIDVEIIQGQKEPVVQGWMPTGRHNELRPIPTAVIRLRAKGPTLLAYAIIPYEGNEPSNLPRPEMVTATKGRSNLAVCLRFADRTDTLVLTDRSGGEVQVDGFATDAEIALIGRAADGNAARLFFVGGTYLRQEGEGGRDVRVRH
ncbi:MAG: alginate lyase family protein [Planctomycetota bacterium]